MGTPFSKIYNRFLEKITDDMYIELTPQDTIKDLRNLLIGALPKFEFPKVSLEDYEISQETKREDEVDETEFIIGLLWDDTFGDDEMEPPFVVVENSAFTADLTNEEINIIAILMMCGWVQSQITSIENTRMKYSGSDFKMTSQANHLQKLLALNNECVRQSHHMQRLYKRRRLEDGRYRSNWDVFNTNNF